MEGEATVQADVKGTTLPVLEVALDPGESLVSVHGELSWMSPNLEMKQGTGGHGLFGGLKRMAGGGGLFLTTYAATNGPATVAFAAKLPGRIFPVEIAQGQGYLTHRDGFLCGTPGITPTVGFQQSFRAGVFGGDGFVLQRLEGQGTAWIELAGEVVTYDLGPGQGILVHPGHIGLFEDRVGFQMSQVHGIANKLFGGDGFWLVALTGPGKVWLQTMPLPVLAHALAPYLGGGSAPANAGAAGVLGGMRGGGLGKSV